jgi:hypothetical protein
MKAEDDDHHRDIDGREEGKAPLHKTQLGQRFERKPNYQKQYNGKPGEGCKISVQVKPDGAAHINNKYENGDNNGALIAESGLCKSEKE